MPHLKNSAAQPHCSSMVSSEFGHDDENEISVDECEDVAVDFVIKEEACAGQLVERSRSGSNVHPDETATGSMECVVDWEIVDSYEFECKICGLAFKSQQDLHKHN